ncbi:MAG: hypothetical protein AMS26_19035 [Bacteroides sp. SM23_62]|nr:MAG: hypothetical protein AMS26_19035 [Bacteroides sp. SM23_62]
MKEITITGKRFRTELRWLLGCFMAAIVFNGYAIIRYQTSWAAFFTSLQVVLILSLVFYVLLMFVRGLITLIIRFSTRNRKA